MPSMRKGFFMASFSSDDVAGFAVETAGRKGCGSALERDEPKLFAEVAVEHALGGVDGERGPGRGGERGAGVAVGVDAARDRLEPLRARGVRERVCAGS